MRSHFRFIGTVLTTLTALACASGAASSDDDGSAADGSAGTSQAGASAAGTSAAGNGAGGATAGHKPGEGGASAAGAPAGGASAAGAQLAGKAGASAGGSPSGGTSAAGASGASAGKASAGSSSGGTSGGDPFGGGGSAGTPGGGASAGGDPSGGGGSAGASGGAGPCGSLCKVGGPKDASCDPCVAKVCAAEPSCCSTEWNAYCAGRAAEECGPSAGCLSPEDSCVEAQGFSATSSSACEACVQTDCAVPYDYISGSLSCGSYSGDCNDLCVSDACFCACMVPSTPTTQCDFAYSDLYLCIASNCAAECN
ncbi:MAG: hypothetical protein IT374_01690 [Polyangiaceae bacterium]|nr:hypothetical protein [Polyangiaceae bacterium]